MTRTLSTAQILGLNAYWVGLSFMWNALHPIILPAILLNYVPDARKNTYLGILTFAGMVIAMVVQPISGAISDRWSSPHGRRRPLMLVGTVFACFFLIVLGWSGGLAWLFAGYVGLQLGANVAQGPLQGLLRDRVPVPQLGHASSIKVGLDVASLALAALVAGRLMGAGVHGSTLPILVVLGLLIACAAITIVSTPEEPTDTKAQMDRRKPAQPAERDQRPGTTYWLVIAERAVFLLGIYGLQTFGQYYLRDVLRVANPPREAGNLLAAIGAGVIVLALAGGRLTDQFGAKAILYAASGITAIGMLLMVLATDEHRLFVFASLVGGGFGLFLTSNWALANRLAPVAQAGRFLGLTNLATAGSAALARLQGPAVDYLNAARPTEWIGYKAIFFFGAVCITTSAYFLTRIKEGG